MRKIGILYSEDVYESVPDPLALLDGRFRLKVVGDLIEDLRRKIMMIGGSVHLVDENNVKGFGSLDIVYSFPLFRYVEKDLAFIQFLKDGDRNGMFFNSFEGLEASANKVRTSYTFQNHEIPTPATLITSRAEEAVDFVKSCGSVVTKPEIGSESMGIISLSWSSAEGKIVSPQGAIEEEVVFDDTTRSSNPRLTYSVQNGSMILKSPFFLQEYVGDRGINRSVLKIYVVDGIITSGLRIAKPEAEKLEDTIISYNDLGQGAIQELILPDNLPATTPQLAAQATKAFGLRSGLVDLVWDGKRDQWVVLEVNNDDFGKIRDRSERMHTNYLDGGVFDWNQRLAEALCKVKNNNEPYD